MSDFQKLVTDELHHARSKHGDMNSLHEAYAVILEELDEFWEEVRRQEHRPNAALAELVSVAAMAQRAAEDLKLMRGAGL